MIHIFQLVLVYLVCRPRVCDSTLYFDEIILVITVLTSNCSFFWILHTGSRCLERASLKESAERCQQYFCTNLLILMPIVPEIIVNKKKVAEGEGRIVQIMIFQRELAERNIQSHIWGKAPFLTVFLPVLWMLGTRFHTNSSVGSNPSKVIFDLEWPHSVKRYNLKICLLSTNPGCKMSSF